MSLFSNKRNRSDSESSEGSDYNKFRMDSNQRNGSQNSNTVYVSNISFECETDELLQEFSAAGNVTNIEMLKNENNRFKGCALITFSDTDMAAEAINSLNRKDFKGRKLVVKEEDQNPDLKQKQKRPRNDNSKPSSLLSMNLSNPIQSNASSNFSTYGLSMNFLQSHKIELPLLEVVFVANLGYDVTESHLKDIFRIAGHVVDCEIFSDKEGKSRGFGIVEFEHPLEAVQAVSMLHNHIYRDRPLSVRMDRSEKRRDVKLPQGLKSVGMGLGPGGLPLKNVRSLEAQSTLSQIQPLAQLGNALMGSQPSGSSNSGFNSMSGMNPYNQSGGYSGFGGGGSLGNILQVQNLPLHYSQENLRKLVWNCGDVLVAEIRSKGTGIVKMRSDGDARRTMQMLDQQPLEGRVLRVNLL